MCRLFYLRGIIYIVSDSEGDGCLYIKTGCSFCMEGFRKGVFANCPYCNHERKTYIQAPLLHIAKYIKSLDKESQVRFLALLDEDPEDL